MNRIDQDINAGNDIEVHYGGFMGG